MIKLFIIAMVAALSFSAQAQFFNFGGRGGGDPFAPYKDRSGCWKFNAIQSKYETKPTLFGDYARVPIEGDACALAVAHGTTRIKAVCAGDCEVHAIAEPVNSEVSCAVLLMGGCGGGRHVAAEHREHRERREREVLHKRREERHEAPPAWTPPPRVEAVN